MSDLDITMRAHGWVGGRLAQAVETRIWLTRNPTRVSNGARSTDDVVEYSSA